MSPFLESPLSISGAAGELCGTFCAPSDFTSGCVVVFIHGSGPLDRNENMPGQALSVFDTLAHALTEVGVASFRYDKRGCGESEGNYFSSGHFDLVADVCACVEHMFARQDTTNIVLIGHSEGCVIAPQVARRHTISGMLLLCPFAQPLEDILVMQAKKLAKDLSIDKPGIKTWLFNLLGLGLEAQQKFIDRIKHSSQDMVRIRFKKTPAKWFRELFSLDIEKVFLGLDTPTLILAGGKDIQCDAADANNISQWLDGKTDVHVVPNLSHLLREELEEASFQRYKAQLKQPISPIVAQIISHWFQQHFEL